MKHDWKRLALRIYDELREVPPDIEESLQKLLAEEQTGSLIEGARLLPLTQGQVAFVDPEDYDKVATHRWFAVRDDRGAGPSYYARAKISGKSVSLHRFLIGEIPQGAVVDHIDRNPLNNRRINLRVVNKYQSAQNRRAWVRSGKASSPQSRFKGVYGRFKADGSISWRAVIKKDLQIHNLGCFTSEVEAAKAYDSKAVELHGEYAVLNFPGDRE